MLIITEAGEDVALDNAKTILAVAETRRVYGAYDMIVRIDEQYHNNIGATVKQLRNTEGIRSTLTLSCVEP